MVHQHPGVHEHNEKAAGLPRRAALRRQARDPGPPGHPGVLQPLHGRPVTTEQDTKQRRIYVEEGPGGDRFGLCGDAGRIRIHRKVSHVSVFQGICYHRRRNMILMHFKLVSSMHDCMVLRC